MDQVKNLSAVQCILLAANLAADANVDALRSLTYARRDVFDAELAYRILLTFLPESLEPAAYINLVDEIGNPARSEPLQDGAMDTSSIDGISESHPRKLLRKLQLLRLRHCSIPEDVEAEPLVLFLIHRAHKVEEESGLLLQVVDLLQPFLDRSKSLHTWFVSTILPLLRLDYEYYPDHGEPISLDKFEQLRGETAIRMLLSRTRESAEQGSATEETVGRDLRGIVGPWIYGSNQRKRRRLTVTPGLEQPTGAAEPEREDIRHWHYTFEWITGRAVENFPLAVKAIEGWDGPRDVDLGEHKSKSSISEMTEQEELELQHRYCRSAFAAIYAADHDAVDTIDGAHSVLVRLASLLNFEPPPDLATSVHLLPRIERQLEPLEMAPIAFLQFDALLQPDNPLTKPVLETFSLLQMFVFSSYLLSGMGQKLSISTVAKLCFWSDQTEQLRLVQRILRDLVNSSRKDEEQWQRLRDTLRWLWSWDLQEHSNQSSSGFGVFGKIERETLEKECLKALCTANQFSLVEKIYLSNSEDSPLPLEDVEKVIVDLAFHYYDNASNGNRNRGGVKKASDIVAAFSRHFPQAPSFRRFQALLSATHSLSFYSLTLQHGVPFQPVSIRVNKAPVSLVQKVLEQNPRSYTKLDDLIEISRNLTIATAATPVDEEAEPVPQSTESRQIQHAEHGVIGMAIEAALAEDDFETAYSYVVNRLHPQSSAATMGDGSGMDDDEEIAWRAAFLAGRHRSTPPSNRSKDSSHSSAHVRRLEQRMDLLSQSLVLAPPSALPEVLAAWRRCEEELLTVLAQESEAEQSFDDKADQNELRSIPGGFGGGVDASLLQVQPRRKEIGRGVGEEAPMGLFDVARGAAAAFGKTTNRFGAASRGRGATGAAGASSGDADEQQGRVRKRDMVANAVTGRLASGIGWVLGAAPVRDHEG